MAASLLQEALALFQQKQYLLAYDRFATVGHAIGMEFVAANLRSCLRRNARIYRDFHPAQLRLACILDDFSWQSYSRECRAIQLEPGNWLGMMENFQPHLLLVESAWHGKDELWRGKVMPASRDLIHLVGWFRKQGIPTVFWNKEDPVHYEEFLGTAALFDFVFTTDSGRIPHYKHKLKHERVFYLPFANQPRKFNPLNKLERDAKVCFAGSWYPRYTERCRNFRSIAAGLAGRHELAIYDRNMNRKLLGFCFPDEFQPCILGTLPAEQVDRAYKGYSAGITLNTVKQSQTMYARRALELMACNTAVISNYSAGLKMSLGDLAVCSDNSREIARRLDERDEITEEKLRLSALRKVMRQYSCRDTLGRIVEKALGFERRRSLPALVFVGFAQTGEQAAQIQQSYMAQTVTAKRLVIFMPQELTASMAVAQDISAIAIENGFNKPLASFILPGEWLATLSAEDWYGPNCFLDMLLATRYWDGKIIGKGERHSWKGGRLQRDNAGITYEATDCLSCRCLLCDRDAVHGTVGQWLGVISQPESPVAGLAVDPFNYCTFGAARQGEVAAALGDVTFVESGCDLEDMYRQTECFRPEPELLKTINRWSAEEIFQMCCEDSPQVHFTFRDSRILVQSSLPRDVHRYFFRRNIAVGSLPFVDGDVSFLKVTPGCDIKYFVIYKDAEEREISRQFLSANAFNRMQVPDEAVYADFALRIANPGRGQIHNMDFGYTYPRHPQYIVGKKIILITTFYPDYDNLYKNAFIHTRVLAYKRAGLDCDVFCLHPGRRFTHREFQGVGVMTGCNRDLDALLANGAYKEALIHLLNRRMWTVLERYPDLPKIVWIHGIEIQPWQRRGFNYSTQAELDFAVEKSDERMALWREILEKPRANLHLVFVSRHFMQTALEDVGVAVPGFMRSVIHNYIDGQRFVYVPKTAEMRKKILLLRPFASRKYGNDLACEAICQLSGEPFFHDLTFHIAGEGELFDAVTGPLRRFDNVQLDRRFLPQTEIPSLYARYGVFLCPTRMDSQGVSRDEAMASGLVPVTNSVAAIPEFTDAACAMLAEAESATGLAAGIKQLYENPDLFLKMSRAAALRPRTQSGYEQTIGRELSLIRERLARN